MEGARRGASFDSGLEGDFVDGAGPAGGVARVGVVEEDVLVAQQQRSFVVLPCKQPNVRC
jgi:hypothetical protein